MGPWACEVCERICTGEGWQGLLHHPCKEGLRVDGESPLLVILSLSFVDNLVVPIRWWSRHGLLHLVGWYSYCFHSLTCTWLWLCLCRLQWAVGSNGFALWWVMIQPRMLLLLVSLNWLCSHVLQFNLMRVEIHELRPEVVTEGKDVLVHYQSRINVWWRLSSKTLA